MTSSCNFDLRSKVRGASETNMQTALRIRLKSKYRSLLAVVSLSRLWPTIALRNYSVVMFESWSGKGCEHLEALNISDLLSRRATRRCERFDRPNKNVFSFVYDGRSRLERLAKGLLVNEDQIFSLLNVIELLNVIRYLTIRFMIAFSVESSFKLLCHFMRT